MSYPGGPSDVSAPPPPPPAAPTYPPSGPTTYAPVATSTYSPTVSPGPKWPKYLDIGLFVIGIGALLTFIGFLFGDGFAANAYGSGANFTNAQGDLETFFVVTGFGILLIVGGWFWRVLMIARRGRP